MYALNVGTTRVRPTTPRRLSVAVLATLSVFAAACADVAGPTSAPSQRISVGKSSIAASSFVVLANAAVTCTNGGITGNVGMFQLGSVTQTGCPVDGNISVGDSAATFAYGEFLNSYAELTPKLDDVCTTLTGTLDGVILAPGDYCYNVAATLAGVLTLDGPADGIWNIKVGASGTGALTGTGFSVVLANGAQACNVTWWVADAATMTGSSFSGNLLAGVAITMTGGTFNGHMASKSAITTTGTVVAGC